MELKERKRIMNSRLPRFENGLNLNGGTDSLFSQFNMIAPNLTGDTNITKEDINNTVGKIKPLDFKNNNSGRVTRTMNLTPWFSVASEVAKGVGTAVAAMNKDVDSILTDSGRTSANVNGFGYEKQNAVDADSQMREYNAKTWEMDPLLEQQDYLVVIKLNDKQLKLIEKPT